MNRASEEEPNEKRSGADRGAPEAPPGDPRAGAPPPTRLYRRRWLIVLLFTSYSLCNSYQWIQYGIINNIFMKFYGVETFTIDWMSMIYMLTYIPLIFPVTWLLDKKGLRVIALAATALNCAGTWIKVASVRPDLFPVTFLGQFCCSLAQVFILGMPARTASVWFGSEEVSTACSIGVFGNQFADGSASRLMQQNNPLKQKRANAEPAAKEWPPFGAAKNLTVSLASLRWSPEALGGALSAGSGSETLGGPAELGPETEIYCRRWLMLFLFGAVSASNAFMGLQYAIIGNTFMRFYSVDSLAVDWLSLVYLLTYVPLILPVLWLWHSRGIRDAILVGSAFNTIGSWIKIGSAGPDLFPVAFLGQFVCSVATVFILGIPSYLASVWFGEEEVSTACSIGVLGNQLGCAIGFLLPPILVPNVDDMDELAHHIRVMFYITAGVATFLFILVVFVFQERPPLPPTLAQATARCLPSEEYSYVASILRLLRNRPFVLLILTYGLNVGCYYAVGTLLNRMIILHYPNEEVNAGRIGLTIIVSGMVGSLICGLWLDRTKTYKQTTLAVYLMSLVGMIVYTATLDQGHLWVVFITAGSLGFFMTGYLPLGFEFAVELTYPESEGTSSGLLNCSAQVFGIIFTICQGKIIDAYGTRAGNIFLCVFLLIGTVMTGLIKSDLRRQKANQIAKEEAERQMSGQDYGATALLAQTPPASSQP